MANFKLQLLIPDFTQQNKYLAQTISEFNSQISNNNFSHAVCDLNNDLVFIKGENFCYSFDESFSIHNNADKDLTFSMLQKHFDEFYNWNDNPFVNLLQVGSILLLTDKYEKTYLFIVKNVDYKFMENNIEYKYVCKDLFSYQLSRQNAGYTIINNENEIDFIGAQNIDWWIQEKIHKDCKIPYSYIPTNLGLYIYEDDDNKKHIDYFASDDDLENLPTIIKNLQIIKHCDYNKIALEPFALSLNNSNAKSALITTVDQIGYTINNYDFWDNENSIIKSYYWVEPSKNDRYTGLQYSPFKDVQNFSLSLNGDSLTTVLNINPITKNKEELTLLPSLSPFFANLISSDDWKNSIYTPGYYSNLLEGSTKTICYAAESTNQEIEYITEPGLTTIKILDYLIKPYYDFLAIDKKFESYITFISDSGEKENRYLKDLDVQYKFSSSDLKDLKWKNSIPPECKNVNNGCLIIKAVFEGEEKYTPFMYNINITQSGSNSEEDKLFAKIADNCPWLENVLINFNYFLGNNILDNNEYKSLMSLFTDKLRIINGQLMFYSKAYYNALAQKTKIIADLTSRFDNIGAWIKYNVIDKYSETGTVSLQNDFNALYNSTFFNIPASTVKIPLINLDDTISDYFKKYFNSQQRFLKNIYNFKNYFNQLNRYSGKRKYTYDISIDSTINLTDLSFNTNYYLMSLNTGEWVEIQKDEKINNYDIITKKDGLNYIIQEFVSEDNYFNYWVKKSGANSVDYQKAFSINNNTVYYKKEGNSYNKKTYEELYTLNNYELNKYYYKTTNYQEFVSNFNPLSKIFCCKDSTDEYFFDANKINNKLHNEIFSLKNYSWDSSEGKENIARCYVTNLPITQLYCQIADDNHYEPINYIIGTWDGYVDSSVWSSTSGTSYSLIKRINEVANNSGTNNSYYRKIDSDIFDTEGLPNYTLNSIKIEYSLADQENNTDLNNVSCKYWSLGNIRENIEDSDFALFATSNDFEVPSSLQPVELNPPSIPIENVSYETYQSYFSKIMTTFCYNECKRYYIDSYWKYLKQEDILDTDLTYYKLNWSNIINNDQIKTIDDFEKLPIDLQKDRISILKYYFLKEYCEPFNMTEKKSVKEFLEIEDDDSNSSIKTWDNQRITIYKKEKNYYSIFIAEDFDIELITGEDNMPNAYTTVYDIVTDKPFLWYENQQWLEDIYYLSPSGYMPATSYSAEANYYKIQDESIIPILTKDKIENDLSINKYYRWHYNTLKLTNWSEDEAIVFYPVLQHIYKDSNTKKITIKTYNSPSGCVIDPNKIDNNKYVLKNKPIEFENNNYYWLNSQDQNRDITFEIGRSWSSPFSGLSNGEFWYENYNKFDDHILFQEAAVIESQLTEYWNVAYNASLNCEFLIPQNWQPTVNGSINHFKDLLYLKTEKGFNFNPNFLPNINLITDVPSCDIHFSSKPIVLDNNNKLATTNIAINHAINYINKNKKIININNLYLTERNYKTTYYYADLNTGMQWQNILNWIKGTNNIYNELSGGYVMLLRFLLKHYEQQQNVKYETLKTEQQSIWYNIIKQYPGIILQNSFTPKDENTCEDVLHSALNMLKDLSQSERQYDITLLENKVSDFKLSNYCLQELHIGDPIALKAEEYYRQYDSTYNILQSYLFITDISYKLREDSSLKITVNNLKYQDKLLQSLVKLIR